MAKTHRIPDICRLFSSKKPYIGHSFAERDLQLKVSYEFSPLCNVRSDWTAGFVEMIPADGLGQHVSRANSAATHCHTLHHTATHCNTLRHTVTHCNTLQHTATHTATHCDTLRHTATHCNTLQHTATLQHTHTYRSGLTRLSWTGRSTRCHGLFLRTMCLFHRRRFLSRYVCCRCVAVCCSVLQCVAVCCSVLQCVAMCLFHRHRFLSKYVCCSVLQCVAVCCSVMQCDAV